VYASIVYLVAALFYAIAGNFLVHAGLMLYSSLILFPYGIAIAYIASGALRRSFAVVLASAGGVILVVLPTLVAAVLGLEEIVDALVSLAGFLAALSSGYVALNRKGSIRLSLFMVCVTMINLSVIPLLRMILVSTSLFEYAIALVIGFPISLIYAVTVHSLPSTFNDKPLYEASIPLPFMNLLASILVLSKWTAYGILLLLFSLALYIVAARIYRVPRYLDTAKQRSGVARRGLLYFLYGHVAVIISILIIVIYSLAFIAGSGFCRVLCVLHELALGFTSLHVYIHAPIMIPVILGIKHRRRFNPIPYLATILAMLFFPLNTELALIFYVIAFLSTVFIVI
jgi:hypothetical protein